MNSIDLKYHICQLYKKALSSENKECKAHPVAVVQSVKSIIGINPADPLDNLIEFTSNYLVDFEILKFKEESNEDIHEVISFGDFESSLKSKDINKAYESVNQLSKVSDAKHILEFLLEFSIKYDLECFYNIWSVYKMMLFLGGEDIKDNLFFCINQIVLESKHFEFIKLEYKDCNLKDYVYNKSNFRLLMIYYAVLNEDLVRKNNISKYIKNNIYKTHRFVECDGKFNVFKSQKKEGRKWINHFCKSADNSLLNCDVLLTLEACRGALKVCSNEDKKVVWHNLNIYLEENGFK